MSEASALMPHYKCHKEVWALKIKDIVPKQLKPLSAQTARNLTVPSSIQLKMDMPLFP